MYIDNYGRQVLSENDLCEVLLKNPEQELKSVLMISPIAFSDRLEIKNIPKIIQYEEYKTSVSEFDENLQSKWFMPAEYMNMDIAKWVLDQCQTDAELQRVGEELLRFQELGMFSVLSYCKYLVDTMRKNNVVWGVGRGSSVASYVLYLIGVHRINSLHYDLSIDEFLK